MSDEAPPMPPIAFTESRAEVKAESDGFVIHIRIATECKDTRHFQALLREVLKAATRAEFDYVSAMQPKFFYGQT